MQAVDQLLLKVGAPVGVPPTNHRTLFVDTDGVVKALDSSGGKSPLGGGSDMRSIIAQTAASILPAGFAESWTDLLSAQDHGVSSSAGAGGYAPVNTESGGKRRLSTLAAVNVSEIIAQQNPIPVCINPKTSAWYVEGRAAIETHGANSLLLPASIALTSGGTMVGPPTSDTFVGLGLAGTGLSGGNNSFLSLVAASAGVMVIQTTTIPWSALIKSYGLSFDGAGTVSAWVDGVVQWQTTTLTQIPVSGGFHANQWIYASDATVTTMLCDSLYGAGPRI
jgi:hypothetical protein